MTTLKIGSSLTPQLPSLRPAGERPVPAVQQTETATSPRPLATRDEFVSSASSSSAGVDMGDTFEAQSTTEASEPRLPASLEPFREALDGLVSQITPELLSNPGELLRFVGNAIRELGLSARDLQDAAKYVEERYAQAGGRDRFA